jgi:hypothetical protein
MMLRAFAFRQLCRRPSMPATLLNAPARPLLTSLVLLLVAIALLAVLSLASMAHAPMRPVSPEPDHPRFARRMSTLPAIVVTSPGAASRPGDTAIRVR